MEREKLIKTIGWIGLILLLLLACSLLEMPISTPAPPTLTPIPSTSTPIPPTAAPASPTANLQVEQASAFADPILSIIANYSPHFEDDFSTRNKGWETRIWFKPDIGSATIQDGVARLEVIDSIGAFDNENINSKDFVLQLDVRFLEGDDTTTAVIIFHISGEHHHFDVELSSFNRRWVVRKLWGEGVQMDFVEGIASLTGKWMQIQIVARRTQLAVYLDGKPIAYVEDANFDNPGHTSLQCQTITKAVCEFDNVRFWNLAKVSELP